MRTRLATRLCICLAVLFVSAVNAIAGTVVFPSPNGGTTCQMEWGGLNGSCGVSIQFTGGHSVNDTGTVVYQGGGAGFPTCTSNGFSVHPGGAGATLVTATMWNTGCCNAA